MSEVMTSVKVSKNLQSVAKQLETTLSEVTGESVSFSLFVWTKGRVNYISNSKDRTEIKVALQSIIDGWDKGMPDIPAHKIS